MDKDLGLHVVFEDTKVYEGSISLFLLELQTGRISTSKKFSFELVSNLDMVNVATTITQFLYHWT